MHLLQAAQHQSSPRWSVRRKWTAWVSCSGVASLRSMLSRSAVRYDSLQALSPPATTCTLHIFLQGRPWRPSPWPAPQRLCSIPWMRGSTSPPTCSTLCASPPALPPWCAAAACSPPCRSAVDRLRPPCCLPPTQPCLDTWSAAVAAPLLPQVGVSDCAPDEAAVPLAERFSAAYRLQPALEAAELGVGSCVVAAELWPAQGLAKGTAAPSQVLQNALARPDTGSRLLVFAAPAAETPAASSLAAHGSSSSGSSSSSSICAEVYLRMCSRPAAGGTAAPVLLPLHEEAASSGGGTEQRPATPVPEVQSPATRGRAGAPAALSPAMRGGAAPPVALSPAMRGGVDTPSMPRGRASSTTAQSSGKGAAGQPGQRPGASSSGGGSRAAAAAAREQDRAKAEALLGSLLDQGEARCPGVLLVFALQHGWAAG